MENKKAKTEATKAETTKAETTKKKIPFQKHPLTPDKMTIEQLSEKSDKMGLDPYLNLKYFREGDKKAFIEFIKKEEAEFQRVQEIQQEMFRKEGLLKEKFQELEKDHSGSSWSEKLAMATYLAFVERERSLPESGSRTKNQEVLGPIVSELFPDLGRIKWSGNAILLASGAISALRLVATLLQDDKLSGQVLTALKENRQYAPTKKMG